MDKEIRVPEIGENIDKVEIAEVAVAVGDTVGPDDTLLTLESDKAAMDLPAETSGTVKQLLVAPGDTVKTGDLLLVLEAESAQARDTAPAAQASPTAPAAGTPAQPSGTPEPDGQAAPARPQATAAQPETQRTIVVPEVGDNVDEVTVAEIAVAVGDTVGPDDTLLTLESDKAAMDLPAETSGTVTQILVGPGDQVRQGDALMVLATAASAEAPPTPAPMPVVQDELPPAAAEAPPAETPQPPAPVASEASQKPAGGEAAPAHASPSVRKFARELGVDIHGIPGSGRKGRITAEDVKRQVKQLLQGGAGVGGGTAAAALPEIDFSQWGPVESVPLSRIRRLTGKNLGRSWPQVPQVTQFDRADITELEAFRKAQRDAAEARGTRLTLLAIVMKAVACSLRTFPDFNASLHVSGETLIHKHYIHLGIAVDTPGGLVVPVVRDVDTKTILDLAQELQTISEQARGRSLKPDQLQGSSFAISSLGGIGGTAFTPVVNWPNVAILGLSRASVEPVWDEANGNFAPRLMLPLSLSYDHRVIDGAVGAHFTRHLAGLLEDIRTLLL